MWREDVSSWGELLTRAHCLKIRGCPFKKDNEITFIWSFGDSYSMGSRDRVYKHFNGRAGQIPHGQMDERFPWLKAKVELNGEMSGL